MNSAACTGHPGRRLTGRNHRLLYSGPCSIGHGHRPITLGCRCGSDRPLGSNRRHDLDDPVTVVAHYPYYGRIDARPTVSRCFEARSGELELSSCG